MEEGEGPEKGEGLLPGEKKTEASSEVEVTAYHRTVQSGILLHGRERDYPKGRGDDVPIPINHPIRRKVHLYRPDASFVSAHGKIHIFEVLDSQVKDESLTIADIIQSYLVPNVARIVFVVPTPSDQDRIQELALIVYGRLVEMGIAERNLRAIRFIYITHAGAKTPRKLANVLRRAFRD